MKKFWTITILVIIVIVIFAGSILQHFWSMQHKNVNPQTITTQSQPLFWQAPYDPSYHSDKPGKSPLGDNLVPVYVIVPPTILKPIVNIPANDVQNMGITMTTAMAGTLTKTINAVGIVKRHKSEHSTVTVQAKVFPPQAQWVQPGQTATGSVTAYPNKTWIGHVSQIDVKLDPVNHARNVQLIFANHGHQLRREMVMHLVIQVAPEQAVVIVPFQAVVPTMQGPFVIQQIQPGQFQAIPVSVGFIDGNTISLTHGLQPGSQIVTNGQNLIGRFGMNAVSNANPNQRIAN